MTQKIPIKRFDSIVKSRRSARVGGFILDVPWPEPLFTEVLLPVRLALTKRGQNLRTSETKVTLRPGRNSLVASLSLSAALFDDGPGRYELELSLDGRSLAKMDFQHRTRQQLKEAQAEANLQSLQLESPQLFALRDGERIETDHIFATDEAICPRFTIIGNGFGDDVPAIKWRVTLRLIKLDNNTVLEKHRFLTAKAGINAHEDLSLRLTMDGHDLLPGSYAFQCWKRDQLLTEFRFRLLAVEEIAPYTQGVVRQSVRAERIRLFALTEGFRLESLDILDSTEFIVPEFTLHSSGYNRELTIGLIAPGQHAELSFELVIDSAAIAQTRCEVSLANGSQAVEFRPVPLTKLVSRDSTTSKSLVVVVRIAGRERHRRTLTLVCQQRIANFEGQLNVDPHHLDVDESEYAQILRRL